ncbi:MAG: hypothetical protein FJ026_01955, partial [Chloroflexi bacterium]|nr:hypothetical protein [Chloroflexota bacterium]
MTASMGNPYVVERPLGEDDHFVGRDKLLFGVIWSIKHGQRFTLVYGARRTGKTSFLRRLGSELRSEFQVVSVDMSWQGCPGSEAEGGWQPAQHSGAREPQEVAALALRELKAKIDEQVGGATATVAAGSAAGTAPEGSAGGIPGDSVAVVEREAGREPGIVVLVDGLSLQNLAGEAGSEFLSQWQAWISSVPDMYFVVTVEGHVDGALALNSALTSLSSIQLEGLTLEEAEELLLGLAPSKLTYEFAAVRYIWQLTAGHPYLVQVFGHVLFGTRPGVWRVALSDVDRATEGVLISAGPVLEEMWQRLSPRAKLLLALAGDMWGRHGIVHVQELHVAATERRVELDEGEIEDGLAELLAIGLVRRLGTNSYSLWAELLRLWLVRHRPLTRTLGELKGHRYTPVKRQSSLGGPRSSIWGVSLVGAVVIAFVTLLWNMRGSAARSSTGPVATATPAPFATRPTLVIGPALGRIVYMARENPDAHWDIWVMRADGTDPQRLTDSDADDMSPAWSPDGKSVVFVSDRDGNREIYVMKADGTQQVNLTRHASEDWTPAWSPDGASIAFASYRDGNWEIYVMDANGANPRRLTNHRGADYAPSWSPDGQQIAFQSNRDGNWEIYVINADGTGLARLTDNEATDSAPAWSPDGSEIVFESYRDGNMEIYVMAADGTAQRNVSNEPYANDHGPAWAWDGTKLIYFSNRDGGWDIFSMRLDGTEKVNLTLSPVQEQG